MAAGNRPLSTVQEDPAECAGQSIQHVIKMLGMTEKAHLEQRHSTGGGDHLLSKKSQASLYRPFLPLPEIGQPSRQVVEHRGHGFGGCRRGRGPVICGKVRQRKIDFMADGRHYRYGRVGDGPHHNLLVKAPQILPRPTAASHDHDIDPAGRADRSDALRDLRSGPLTLHRNGADEDLQDRTAPPDDGQHVPQSGSGQRGHEPDAARQQRERPLA